MSSGRFRFDLFSLLEWTAGIAFVCALLAASGGRGVFTYTFARMPPDDAALVAWLEDWNVKGVTVTRSGEELAVSWSMSVWSSLRHDQFSMPHPPWKQLGYSGPGSVRYSSQWSMFGGSTWLWLSGLGILIALHMVRKRFIEGRRPRDLAAERSVAPSES